MNIHEPWVINIPTAVLNSFEGCNPIEPSSSYVFWHFLAIPATDGAMRSQFMDVHARQLPTPRGQCESFGLFLLLGATMLVPYLLYLEPLTAGMISIKWEMCGGNQTFVVANNPEVQQIIGYRTQEARNDQETFLSQVVDVVVREAIKIYQHFWLVSSTF